ncbi:MAG: hypothetical protein B6A08_06330 [Sorangiineae bacterium NIC37A_2]|jgi:hypothetical protein|nr:MAG: hypothetical protein B6A08_18735 [Sorangiineae bacterium NIC37A_2]OQX69300.1 MAG: hypothetical protein B6A08_06330 [Sorangiineae bacterium NIC37A_2]
MRSFIAHFTLWSVLAGLAVACAPPAPQAPDKTPVYEHPRSPDADRVPLALEAVSPRPATEKEPETSQESAPAPTSEEPEDTPPAPLPSSDTPQA